MQNPIKKVKQFMTKTILMIKGEEQKLDDLQMLKLWEERFQTAKAQYNYTIFDTLENVYRGTKETVANVNSKDPRAPKKTNNVPNIVYELIESEVNTATPDAVVKSKKPGFEDHAKMIQDKIMSDLDSFNIEAIADINERNTYMHGISVVLMNWNTSLGQHEFIGEKEILNLHPKQVIPQPNIYDIKKMRYCFLICPTTKDEIKERTGVDVFGESQRYPEYNQIVGDNTNTAQYTTSSNPTNEIVDEIVCLYLDGDGDVGKFSFVGSAVTENKPKYFYPRMNECKECGTENAQDAKECTECGGKKLKMKVIMEETIEKEMELSPIVYPKKKKMLKTDQTGKQYVDEAIEQEVIERVVPAGTKIPIPAPKILPIIVRKNIPLNFSFRGRSDVETIRDQQEAVKKSISKAEEKVNHAGGMIGIPENLNKTPSDEIYQIWKGKAADLAQITVRDFQMNITPNIEFAEYNYQKAKSVLGITDSYQGKYDPSAKSGKAKEVQVEQAAGRLQSKIKNKFTFYADMFELMFYFDICFTCEPRPYMKTDENGDEGYEEFNKYELLCQDAEGIWFYNTDFSFKAELGSNLPHDKSFLYEQALMMYREKAIDAKQLLEILSTLDFPIANRILAQIKASEEDDNETMQILELLKTMQPEQLMSFLQLPTEEQISMLQQSKEGEQNVMS
jgi:ribosomal protein L40E